MACTRCPRSSRRDRLWRRNAHARGSVQTCYLTGGRGVDFSAIRLHYRGVDEVCRAFGATALTVGSDIYFRQEAFAPHTREGPPLLAHEVAHVGQQRRRPVTAGPAGEREADAAADALLSGHRFMFGAADGLTADGAAHVVHAGSGQVEARAVVIAAGVTWRRLGVPELEALVGAGVFYGAAAAEARAMAGQDVYVIGAGNSAGQAAIHLSKYAASVTMLVRGPGLAASMSSYLVTEISKTANIRVRPSTEVTGGHGQCSLETLTLRHRISGATETVPAAALFVMIGAEPRTSWLPASIERNDEGFIRTGRDLHRPGELPAGWPLKRPPLLLETSIPGVFATGDIRHRSVKRVASAVGEGATAIQLVHEYLRADQD